MKKEELLKVFPCLSYEEIEDLPTDLLLCWYPSCGNHFDAAFDWQRQNTKLIPNLFIYSDNSDFDIPSEAEVFYSKIVEGGDLKPKNGVVHLTLLKFKENWFFLVNSENEYLYLSFLEQQINIDCLYVNRPCDSFLSDRGPDADQVHFIDIERIGVDLLISGKNNGLRVPFSDDYLMISEFEITNEPFPSDIAVLYSRI